MRILYYLGMILLIYLWAIACLIWVTALYIWGGVLWLKEAGRLILEIVAYTAINDDYLPRR